MEVKTIVLIFLLAGMVSGYNVSVEPKLSDAPNLLTNETSNMVSSFGVNSVIELALIVILIIVLLWLVVFIIPVVWGWIHD